jgi:hypothetical protein
MPKRRRSHPYTRFITSIVAIVVSFSSVGAAQANVVTDFFGSMGRFLWTPEPAAPGMPEQAPETTPEPDMLPAAPAMPAWRIETDPLSTPPVGTQSLFQEPMQSMPAPDATQDKTGSDMPVGDWATSGWSTPITPDKVTPFSTDGTTLPNFDKMGSDTMGIDDVGGLENLHSLPPVIAAPGGDNPPPVFTLPTIDPPTLPGPGTSGNDDMGGNLGSGDSGGGNGGSGGNSGGDNGGVGGNAGGGNNGGGGNGGGNGDNGSGGDGGAGDSNDASYECNVEENFWYNALVDAVRYIQQTSFSAAFYNYFNIFSPAALADANAMANLKVSACTLEAMDAAITGHDNPELHRALEAHIAVHVMVRSAPQFAYLLGIEAQNIVAATRESRILIGGLLQIGRP